LNVGQRERERHGRERKREKGFAFAGVLDGLRREVGFANGDGAIVVGFVDPDDGEWFAPVTLAREEPVAELVVDRGLADALRSEVGGDAFLGIVPIKAGMRTGVDQLAIGKERQRLVGLAGVDDLDDRKVELLREIVVAVIVRGHGHDRAGAVAHDDVVGDPDRNAGAVGGIERVGAGEYAGFFLGEVGALEVAFGRGFFLVVGDLFALLGCGESVGERVFGRDNHVGDAVDSVGARGENLEVAEIGVF